MPRGDLGWRVAVDMEELRSVISGTFGTLTWPAMVM